MSGTGTEPKRIGSGTGTGINTFIYKIRRTGIVPEP